MSFNWKIYSLLNPDLTKSGLTTEQQLEKHYRIHGVREKRNTNLYQMYPDFNVTNYKNNYTDLRHMDNQQLEIHWLKNGRYENRKYNSDVKFDIIICHGPNDDDMLNINIEYNKKNIVGYNITHNDKLIRDDCIVIYEKIFPFTLEDIKNYIKSTNNRYGWYLQQLLKLYAGKVIPNILDYYLVIDCDTLFLKPTTFFINNIPLYNVGNEYHEPYFKHMKLLDKSLVKQIKPSGICHHMMFSKNIVNELMTMIERNKNNLFWKVFLECVHPNNYNSSGASEYELYLTYLCIYHKDKMKLRCLKWCNTNKLNLTINDIKLNMDYISYHWYMR